MASIPSPLRVGSVEPDLLGSALFLYAEYLAALEVEADLDEEDGEAAAPEIDMRAVLDLFAEELATPIGATLNLYMRVAALQRLFAANPSLARLATGEAEAFGYLSEDALIAAARLDLRIRGTGDHRRADFDPGEFRHALDG